MPTLTERIRSAWNAFQNKDPTPWRGYNTYGFGYATRPDRARLSRGNERSIINSVYNRIAIDVSAIPIEHVKLDENGRFKEVVDSHFNRVLNIEANIDQTGRELMQDAVMSMLDEGCVALVPVDTTMRPENAGAFDIDTMRTAKILEWYPKHVRVQLYNDITGRRQELILPKRFVAIIENPFYSVMNEPNSTLQRLIRKLNLLDVVDEQSGSGKLDLIIQLPYVIKTQARRKEAEQRRTDIEMQLAGSKYGVAYTDGTERITQLNRPAENNLLKQVEYLTNTLYSQLGITEDVFNGTADEKTMLNYYNRTIEPILSAFTDEYTRKYLTQTARTQGQAFKFYRDPFRLASVNDIAELGDKFTRNEIATSNEMRSLLGWKPSDDPKADELRNSNISQPDDEPRRGVEEIIEQP